MTYTLAEIRNSRGQKLAWERQYPLSNWVVRPVSFYLAFLILRITSSPSRVALVGFALGTASCVLFILFPGGAVWPAILLLVFYDLLDAVDGTVARTTHNVTHFGRFLDGVIGEIVEGSYCFCLGVGLYLADGATLARYASSTSDPRQRRALFAAAALITFGKHFCTVIQSSYYRLLASRQASQGIAGASVQAEVQSSSFRNNLGYLVFENIHTFDIQVATLILGALLGALDLFLLAYALYYSIRFCVFALFYYRRARATLQGGAGTRD